jgi:hypothetical protein
VSANQLNKDCNDQDVWPCLPAVRLAMWSTNISYCKLSNCWWRQRIAESCTLFESNQNKQIEQRSFELPEEGRFNLELCDVITKITSVVLKEQ